MSDVGNAGATGGIEIRNLCVVRGGRRLFQEVDCFVPHGSFLAVTGKSGSGKTSLLSCMAGMSKPEEGSVCYKENGSGAFDPPSYRLRLGLVFQHLLLTPNSPARTNVLCGLLGQLPWWRTLFGFSKQHKSRASALLARFGIPENALVAKLSGGERQRVAIARALISRPRAILADEPVSSLDPGHARDALRILGEAAREVGGAVVCVLHDSRLVEEFSDQTLVLDSTLPAGWKMEGGRAA